MAKTNPLTRQTPKISAYGIKVTFKPEDLIAIRDNTSYRLTATPFVDDFESVRIPGHAVKWKGAEGIEEVRAINTRVAEGLERAINEYSKPCAGIKGVVRVGNRYLPKKVICQIEKAHKKA
jgi:hypothetical protein